VEFNGTAAQTVSFASPGLVPGTSHFGVVRFANSSAGGVTLLAPAHAHVLEDVTPGTSETLFGGGFNFLTQGLNVDNMVLNNLTLSFGDNHLFTRFDNVTFTSTPSTATQLSVNRLTGPGTMTFNNLSFQTVHTGAGLYLAANGPFTLNLVTPSPLGATLGTDFTQAGGATVNWP